ncbi:hypothetical protein EJ06DRAFT_50691 [Trichodelitschia bisporula]|uniref:Uncharacterized protein n=1 Tax=Trichodelitschia bisporula TaxID=703511 RepID=A0A6G1HUB2_9PEZI|nr:hypothetical protein EJ06DRAFT_50691 [Trichodelitschia bisporula]
MVVTRLSVAFLASTDDPVLPLTAYGHSDKNWLLFVFGFILSVALVTLTDFMRWKLFKPHGIVAPGNYRVDLMRIFRWLFFFAELLDPLHTVNLARAVSWDWIFWVHTGVAGLAVMLLDVIAPGPAQGARPGFKGKLFLRCLRFFKYTTLLAFGATIVYNQAGRSVPLIVFALIPVTLAVSVASSIAVSQRKNRPQNVKTKKSVYSKKFQSTVLIFLHGFFKGAVVYTATMVYAKKGKASGSGPAVSAGSILRDSLVGLVAAAWLRIDHGPAVCNIISGCLVLAAVGVLSFGSAEMGVVTCWVYPALSVTSLDMMTSVVSIEDWGKRAEVRVLIALANERRFRCGCSQLLSDVRCMGGSRDA